MLAPMLHILPLTTIVRERTLPVAGKVNARVNQRVNPTDVIAEANFAREHVLLDVARSFGVSAIAADKMIRVNEGDRLTEGALVAEKRGIFARTIRAPRAGRVMVAGGGQVLMEVGDTRVELRAGLPGMVTQVIAERGVVIRTAGALVQGVWGNGRDRCGRRTHIHREQPTRRLIHLAQEADHSSACISGWQDVPCCPKVQFINPFDLSLAKFHHQ